MIKDKYQITDIIKELDNKSVVRAQLLSKNSKEEKQFVVIKKFHQK
jgi:hypothetical protein